MTEKSELRRALRALPRPDAPADQAVCARILAEPAYAAARCVLAFHPMRAEPDIRPVLQDVLDTGRILLLPRSRPDGRMQAKRVCSLGELVPGYCGIFEPPETAQELTPELVLVPAVAFDEDGFRLGHGGGYYDRYLSRFAGRTLGVCFEMNLLARVPRETHDRPVSAVVTECRTVYPAAWKGGLPDGGSNG